MMEETAMSEAKDIIKINTHSAGVDIGSEKIFIGIEGKEVKNFFTFTEDYLRSISYLKENNISTVAMEATGVYWFAYYDLLEASGIEVYLVNGRDAKNVPGRKSDVADCQWLQQLHSYGLLRRCFIPEDIIRQMRTYTRLRDDHISMASQHIQHMQKAFDSMNIKLHNVISQIHGVSGLRIVRAIIDGNHNPERLTDLCDKSILKNKRQLVLSSLKGNFKEEYIFSLKQAYNAYQFYQGQIAECDKQLELLLRLITKETPPPDNMTKGKPARHNNPKIDDLHTHLMKMTDGKDPAQITGLSDKSLMELIAETGTDLKATWKTEKHFVSWICLAPTKHQSGKSNKHWKKKGHTKAGQIFRNCAYSVINSKYSALAGFYHRIKARKGARVAIKATARKIAILYYNIMTEGTEYVEQGLKTYQQKYKEQQIKRLQKQAKYLGFQIIAA
jgi:transposase